MLTPTLTVAGPTSTGRSTAAIRRSATRAADCPRIQINEQDRELVAAQARHCIARPDHAAEALRDHAEQRVAGRVTVGVVHGLEPVQVARQHGEAATMPPGPDDQLVEALPGRACGWAGRSARRERHVGDPALGRAPHRRVGLQADHAGGTPRRVTGDDLAPYHTQVQPPSCRRMRCSLS